MDHANDPERLERIRELAAEVMQADLHRGDDRNGWSERYEFADLGEQVGKWIADGRPAAEAPALISLAQAVSSHEWGERWTDPGDYPNGLAAGPLPDRWTADSRPNELAAEVLDLIDDMGLLPKVRAERPSAADEGIF